MIGSDANLFPKLGAGDTGKALSWNKVKNLRETNSQSGDSKGNYSNETIISKETSSWGWSHIYSFGLWFQSLGWGREVWQSRSALGCLILLWVLKGLSRVTWTWLSKVSSQAKAELCRVSSCPTWSGLSTASFTQIIRSSYPSFSLIAPAGLELCIVCWPSACVLTSFWGAVLNSKGWKNKIDISQTPLQLEFW